MSAKHYPLDIKRVDEDTYILMSKGHHDPHEFMRKAREEGWTWPLRTPVHTWMRAVPSRAPEYNCIYVEAAEGERGAWPATYAYGVYGDDHYQAPVGAQP
ncbi:hypothetical protein OR16_04302 [Cupriavidus basilensis OR16]|uniref:Uncharacterized protein n=1 Tax=Cupriavidus basilensis OR16 TaxID=1127483 RepID=H1RZV4_9BURK|nr:hypothetical protein [Cupriavidus basilensis]EHP44170.1 hypothetical protein OR16_04302 [Cupriavidus basilensis OR16]